MRILSTILFFASIASVSAGHPADRLTTYVTAFTAVDGRPTDGAELQQLVLKLREKQDRIGNGTSFVNYVFDKARQRFLRHYEDYATFSETLSSRTYNCLTGTALYAILLDELNIPYTIIETNYHIFLVAETIDGRALLEATDGQNGFVVGEENIQARIKKYRELAPAKDDSGKTHYQYEIDLCKVVTLDELTGLLYYNRAVVAYNQRSLGVAVHKLTQAARLYQSPRTAEFAAVLQLTVAGSTLESTTKEQYLRDLQRLRAASANFSARHH